MPHLASCNDKSELGIDGDGNDFCLDCGGIIKPHEDQVIIQEKFLSKKKETNDDGFSFKSDINFPELDYSQISSLKSAVFLDLKVKRLSKKLLKDDIEKLLVFYYRHTSLDKIEASRIFPHLFVYLGILKHDLKVKR